MKLTKERFKEANGMGCEVAFFNYLSVFKFYPSLILVGWNFSEKPNNWIEKSIRENARKPQIWAILGLFCPILGQGIVFFFENQGSSL